MNKKTYLTTRSLHLADIILTAHPDSKWALNSVLPFNLLQSVRYVAVLGFFHCLSRVFLNFPSPYLFLSISYQYLPQIRFTIYLRAAFSTYPTLSKQSCMKTIYAQNGRGSNPPLLTFPCTLFQNWRLQIDRYIAKITWLFMLGSSCFARRHWQNPGKFLLLRLFIRLNSAGRLTWLEIQKAGTFDFFTTTG